MTAHTPQEPNRTIRFLMWYVVITHGVAALVTAFVALFPERAFGATNSPWVPVAFTGAAATAWRLRREARRLLPFIVIVHGVQVIGGCTANSAFLVSAGPFAGLQWGTAVQRLWFGWDTTVGLGRGVCDGFGITVNLVPLVLLIVAVRALWRLPPDMQPVLPDAHQ